MCTKFHCKLMYTNESTDIQTAAVLVALPFTYVPWLLAKTKLQRKHFYKPGCRRKSIKMIITLLYQFRSTWSVTSGFFQDSKRLELLYFMVLTLWWLIEIFPNRKSCEREFWQEKLARCCKKIQSVDVFSQMLRSTFSPSIWVRWELSRKQQKSFCPKAGEAIYSISCRTGYGNSCRDFGASFENSKIFAAFGRNHRGNPYLLAAASLPSVILSSACPVRRGGDECS